MDILYHANILRRVYIDVLLYKHNAVALWLSVLCMQRHKPQYITGAHYLFDVRTHAVVVQFGDWLPFSLSIELLDRQVVTEQQPNVEHKKLHYIHQRHHINYKQHTLQHCLAVSIKTQRSVVIHIHTHVHTYKHHQIQ